MMDAQLDVDLVASGGRQPSPVERRRSAAAMLLLRWAMVLVLACLGGMPPVQPAWAQRGPPDEPGEWVDDPRRKQLTGDWNGWRRWIDAQGIALRGHYIAEIAGNPSGGLAQGTTYSHQVDVGADLDLSTLIGLAGGSLHVTFTERTGYSLSQSFIGNLISVQEIWGQGQNVRLAELAYVQSAMDGRLESRVGWIHASDDFATSPLYCYFMNNGFCGQVATVINSGFSIFPTGTWGGRLKARPVDDIYLMSGVYEVNPTLALPPNGFKLSTAGATGVIVPAQLGWQPRVGPGQLPGHYRVGGYYDTSEAPYLGSPVGGTQSMATGRWGVWLQGDQMLYRPDPGSIRHLTAFAVFGYAGPATALLQTYWQLGLVKKGTFADRDHDQVGLAVNSSRFSSALVAAQNQANALVPGSTGVQSAETTIELNYRLQATPFLSLMPNVQYVIRPNGLATIADALVLGLQVKATF